MANDKNFYEWLGLPVEKFEYDYEFLKNEADKHIRSWISSKSNELQGRAQLYKDEIQEAIKSPEEWRKIYDEYAKKVHATVSNQVDMCSEDLTDEVISNIVSENRVSEGYVNKIIAEKGLKKSGTQSTDKKSEYSLKDLLPDTAIVEKLKPMQGQLEEYDCKDITDFIKKEVNLSLLLENTNKEEIINALNQIQKKWKNKQANRAKAIVDKVVSGFKGFLNDKEVKDYIAFLKYQKVEVILFKKFSEINKLKQTALNEKAFNTTINDIYFVVEDKEKARGILETFCTEKKIGFPRRLPSVAVCPFCGNSFEKANPIQTSCLACRKTFLIKCPKCRSEKNLLVDLTCDGIDLQRYPILERQLENAKGLIESLALKEGRHKISKIQKEWADFPGTDAVEEECRRIEKDYGADLNAIETNKKERKLYSAKMICDRISRSFPKAKVVYEDIYIAISEFEKEIALYKKETNRENKIAMLLNLSEKVTDSAELNAELGKFPIEKPKGVNVSYNEERGGIVIRWNSTSSQGSVDYHVIRKNGSAVANRSDGVEVIATRSMDYCDVNVREGEAYYYAVYASRGPMVSDLVLSGNPVLFLKKPEAVICGRDKAIDISWKTEVGDVKVFYTEGSVKLGYAQGTEWKKITLGGCVIEPLLNEHTYSIGIYKTFRFDGQEYRSGLSNYTVVPMPPLVAPSVSKAMGEQQGEYIITLSNHEAGQEVRFFYSEQPVNLQTNVNMNLSEIQTRLKKLEVVRLNESNYKVRMNGMSAMSVYCATVSGNVAVLGNRVDLSYVKPIHLSLNTLSSDTLYLDMDAWPEGVVSIKACYNNDAYPEDEKDAIRTIPPFTKAYFEKEKNLKINGIGNDCYYFSFFARKSNNEVLPIGQFYLDNSVKNKIYYTVTKKIRGYSIKLETQSESIPELELKMKLRGVPLNINDGSSVLIIPKNDHMNQTEQYAFSGKFPSDSYVKLFCRGAGNCELINKGSAKIN